MIARAATAGLAALLATLPATATAQPLAAPAFARCSYGTAAGASPFTLERFAAEQPALRFETTSELGLQSGKQSNVRSFLTRRAGGDWQLWLVHDWWDRIEFLPPDAWLGIGDAIAPVEGVQKGDNRIFALDPHRLLAAYPGGAPVRYGFRAVGDDGKPRGQSYLDGTIDLAALARALAEARRLAAAADAGTQPCEARGDIVAEAVNPDAYGECRVDGGASLWWDRGYVRLIWQHRLSPAAYLGTDQHLTAEAMHAKIGDFDREVAPASWLGRTLPLAVFVNYWSLPKATRPKAKDQLKLQIDLVTTAATERLAPESYGRIAPAALERLAADADGMAVRILDPAGQLVEESRMSAGTLAAGDALLRTAFRELAGKLKDPMTHCAPPTSIIVT